jgi:hypothetical protein
MHLLVFLSSIYLPPQIHRLWCLSEVRRGNGYGSEIWHVMSTPSGTIDHDLGYISSRLSIGKYLRNICVYLQNPDLCCSHLRLIQNTMCVRCEVLCGLVEIYQSFGRSCCFQFFESETMVNFHQTTRNHSPEGIYKHWMYFMLEWYWLL